MCTIDYVPAACRERCTTDWSISESFSSFVLNETQELTIGEADRARKASKTANNDHAWHDIVDLANKFLVFRKVFIGPPVLKLILIMTRILTSRVVQRSLHAAGT